MKVSFGRISTKGAYDQVWEYGTELYGRFIYFEQGSDRAIIAAFDFSGTCRADARRWREAIAEKCGIPIKGIWYHELQIHAAPYGYQLSGDHMEKLIDLCVPEIKAMIARARECDCFVSESDLGYDFSFNREQYVEGLGGVTVWTGMYFDEEGRPYTQNRNIMLLRGYQPDLPVFDKPIYFDNPNDPKAYLFRFTDKTGKTVGTVSRFAAHPDVAVLFELRFHPDRRNQYKYNFDWCGYLSECLEKTYGGISVYLNGPCADLSTKKGYDGKDLYADADEECRRIGKSLAERLISDHEKTAFRIDTGDVFKADTFDITVPIKEDLPHSLAELEGYGEKVEAAQKALDEAIAADAEPWRIKRLTDDRWRIGAIRHVVEETIQFTDEELEKREITLSVAAMRFGGYLFVGVPGESLVDTSIWLRSQFTGVKTIPVDQVDGYYNYMATPRSLTLGGYTYWQSWVSRDTVPALKRALTPLLTDFLK